MSQRADWDIVTGVGLTALAVAAARAFESSRPDPLVNDPHADAFVAAARAQRPDFPELYTGDGETGEQLHWHMMATYMGVRSRFFDQYLADTGNAGITQVVILAAGLDSRGYRLAWPPESVVYELDKPKVLRFKDEVLAGTGARPSCERRTVERDLREDWPAALVAAGFERDRPTAWLVEGLLPFLPDDATAGLFADIHALSAPGSRIATEFVPGETVDLAQEPRFREMTLPFGFDLGEMWPTGKVYDPAGWLSEQGWLVSVDRAGEVAESYGRPLHDEVRPMRASLLITARWP